MTAAAWTKSRRGARRDPSSNGVHIETYTSRGAQNCYSTPLARQRRTAADRQGAQNRHNTPWYNDATAQATDLNRKPLKLC